MAGPTLLTCSFPYVRDWLNEHPFRNEANARLICNLVTGAPIKPDALCTVIKQLRKRITRLLENGTIDDENERQRLEFLLKTKKWNPYCIRHSAITSDSDYLPEYALKKKVRWSMNSKQSSRYRQFFSAYEWTSLTRTQKDMTLFCQFHDKSSMIQFIYVYIIDRYRCRFEKIRKLHRKINSR
jgi:hypothetical protein